MSEEKGAPLVGSQQPANYIGTCYPPMGTVGIPSVVGDNLSLVLSKFATKLRTVRASILRHGPTCILALRVLLSFAISSLEYGLTLVPLLPAQLAPLQIALR